MKKIFGYVLGLVAALFAAGAVATGANADGSSANAASGSSDNASSGAVTPSAGAGDTSDTDGLTGIADSSSSMVKPARKTVKRVTIKRIKRAKTLAASKEMRGRLHYRKDSREILFQKGKKGAEVELFNRKGREVKKFRVAKNGRFTLKLTKKQAKKLDKGGKYFRFAVHQKGYRPYEIRYNIYK